MIERPRQTGRTRAQMQDAPQKAVFVWCNNQLHYPRCLAVEIERTDLEIVGVSWLEGHNARGRRLSAIVLDHACDLTERQRAHYRDLQNRISP